MEDYAILGGLVAVIWAILLWLSIIVWVYRDIRDRTRDLGLQVLAVFVVMMFFPGFNIPGLALYLMLRPRESLEEAYTRSLEEEALLRDIGDEGVCPSCRRFVERTWRVCPFCQTHLKDVCRECSQLLSFNWVACPHCGRERRAAAAPAATTRTPQTTAQATAAQTRAAPPQTTRTGARAAASAVEGITADPSTPTPSGEEIAP